MKLTKEQKEDLKALTKHKGFKVLETIEEEQTNKLWQMFLTQDITDEKVQKVIREQQIYAKARKDFLNNAAKHIKETYIPDFPWIN